MPAALEIRDLSFRYDDGRAALQEVSCVVQPGECVGLLGPNGAGKSTLLLHLNGILPERLPTETCVFVDGLPLTPAEFAGRPTARRPDVPAVRRPAFLPDRVGRRGVRPPATRGCKAARSGNGCAPVWSGVNLVGFEHRRPHQLSQGEKRRVCLAGVLACEPQVLVLDEPTSDLDPRGRREFKTLLASIPATKIIATHDLELVVELCPRSLLLDGGRLVADGPSATLLADETLMLAHGLERPHILLHRHPHGG